MVKLFCWEKWSEDFEINSENLLLIKASAAEQPLVAECIMKAGARYCITGLNDNIMSIVFTDHLCRLSLPESVQHISLPVHPLCEIMAFLDESQQVPGESDKEFLLNINIASCDELIYWFVCSYLMGNSRDDYQGLLENIRKQESYFLTGYLIKNRCSTEKINSLCQHYGLSYSYFRKISKKYLGVSAKTKMSEWRLAQTILDILEGEDTITDIAMKNGYASSAHVCSTFKSVLGISPYAIRKINGKG
ncbi:helix-turn-helix domain-containing protein [Lelliottia sp. WAP21]|uniref:helix-turn-helix domain-containing protein n=1 Tax=Lelliottia sp. WAP21 TaxID=2877426 RepID=UPI001E354227|nr:helix-turn-helix domain-containing protein [Lelliottia sp. WAP21]